MVILPGIKIKGGRAIRQEQGLFGTSYEVEEDPIKLAQKYEAEGAEWLHVIDIEGPIQGRPVNPATIADIVQATNIKIQAGGGVRTMEQFKHYIDHGVDRVIIGSQAVRQPEMVEEAVATYGPDAVAVTIDSKYGIVYVNGWAESSTIPLTNLVKDLKKRGVRHIVYSIIKMQNFNIGPSFEAFRQLHELLGDEVHLMSNDDIRNFKDIKTYSDMGLYGTIISTPLQTNSLDLPRVLAVAKRG